MRHNRSKIRKVYTMKKSLSLILSVVCLSLIVIGSLTSCDLFGSKYVFTDLGDSYEFSGLGESTDTEISVPAKYKGKPVTAIGKQAFYRSIYDSFYSGVDYPEITAVTLPDTITSIGEQAFAECSGLTSLVIPDSVTSIGAGAFYYCTNLVSVNIPDGITEIKEGTFNGCGSLTSISIPDSVTEIGISAFANCNSITEIKLPAAVTKISTGCFYGCSSLTAFTIEPQIELIGDKAFANCTSLTEITIPNTVTSLGDSVFEETSESLVVKVSYDSEPQKGWVETWYSGMKGQAINTSETYYNNVVVPNQAKADELQAQIDDLKDRILEINDVELPAIASKRNQAQANGNNAAYKEYNNEFRAKQQERDSLAERRNELLDQLKKLPTTNQIN